MGYQFADPFDQYGNNYTLLAGYPWDTLSSAGVATVLNTDFRFTPPGSLPGGCCSVTQGNWIRKNLGSFQGSLSTPATVFLLGGFKLANLPASSPGDIFMFWDTGVQQLCLAVTPNGALQFYRGNVANAIGAITPNGTIQANVWYGAAIAVTVNGSTGSVQLFLNGSGVAAINSTGLNTQATGSPQISQVSIGNSNNNVGVIKYDDFLVYDTAGTFLNALPGYDPRFFTKLPTSAGNYTNWTPAGLGANWQNASQQPPSTADYNANNVGGTKDSYVTASAGLASTPFAVIVRASLERDDAGPHTPSLLMRSGGVDGTSAALPALGSSYVFYDYVPQNDPNTVLPWTGPNVDAAQLGVVEG